MSKSLDRRLRNREYDAKRGAVQEYRAWYKTARWRTVRALQLATQPLCERCWSRGIVTSTFLRLCSRAPRMVMLRLLSGFLRVSVI